MPQLSVNLSYTVEGKSYSQQGNITTDGIVKREKANFPAALSGTLTTRTDADTGVITFTSDPGLSVGNRVDVYWDGGVRRGMKVSSISGSGPWLVTIGTGAGDIGAGDDFPVATTPVTVGKVQSWDFNVLGNNIQALVAACAAKGVVVLASGTETEEWSAVFEAAAGVQGWFIGNGQPNPIAGDTITKVFMSHGDATGTKEVKCAAFVQ
jgi:hypothetical protein